MSIADSDELKEPDDKCKCNNKSNEEVNQLKKSILSIWAHTDSCEKCCLCAQAQKLELLTEMKKTEISRCSFCVRQQKNESKVSVEPSGDSKSGIEVLRDMEFQPPLTWKLAILDLRSKVKELTLEKAALEVRYQTIVKAHRFASKFRMDPQDALFLEIESLAKSNSHLHAENTILTEANNHLTEKLKTSPPTKNLITSTPSTKVSSQAASSNLARWYRSTHLFPGLLNESEGSIPKAEAPAKGFYGPHSPELFW